MPHDNHSDNGTASALWSFVPPGEFHLPAAKVQVTVQTRMEGFWQKLRPAATPDEEEVFEPVDSLHALHERVLQRAVPSPDWQAASTGLSAALESWVAAADPANPVALLTAPPYGGIQDTLRVWAEQNAWTVVDPPTPEQILTQDQNWLAALPGDEGHWVLPALEKCYLRHVRGLGSLRAFLDNLWSGVYGQGVIGCDAWALAYLRNVWHGRMPITYTLQAFDEQRLATWFEFMANPGKRRRIRFRQADNGRYVLPPPEGTVDAAKQQEQSDFLTRLAIYSRGIPGIARAIWRQSLLADADDVPQFDEETDENRRSTTIWVTPWERLKHPAVPGGDRRNQAFVFHSLMLHGGLRGNLLPALLPISGYDVSQTLYSLEAAGLIEHDGDIWRVTALGYPVVRQFLKDEGYLTD